MAQFARPVADINNVGVWTTEPLWSKVDEGAPAGADTIVSPNTANAFCTLELGAVTDPAVSTGHVIRHHAGKVDTSGPTQTAITQLRQGYVDETTLGTLIATLTGTTQEGQMLTETYTLTAGEADAITDYSDLYVRLVCRFGQYDYVELEVPDASGGTPGTATPGVLSAALTLPSASAAGVGVSSPAQIAPSVLVPAVGAAGVGVVSPAQVGMSFTLLAADVAGGGVSTPAAVELVFTVPQAATVTGGAGQASPAQVALGVLLNSVSAFGQGVAQPDEVAVVATMPAVGVFTPGDAAVQPGALELLVVISAPTLQNTDVHGHQTGTVRTTIVSGGITVTTISGSVTASRLSGVVDRQ